MSKQTKNDKSVSTKEYFAQKAKRMDSAETDVQIAAPIESGEQSVSSAPAEASGHTSSEGDVKTMGTKTAAPVKDDALKTSIDATVPADDVDEQIVLGGESMREIIGVPIEDDAVSVLISRNAPDADGEALDNATTPNVDDGAAEPDAPAPADGNEKTSVRPSADRRDKTGIGTASTASPAPATLTDGGEPSVQTVLITDTEPREIVVPTPQTATDEPSTDNGDNGDNGDTRDSTDTALTAPTTDTDPTRRTVKQRKSDLDEYRRRYMQIPRIKDRKPLFVSQDIRDRLDRIVRLLGERGMSVSGLIENIAIRHLETHEPDIEHWRKM